MPAKAMGGRLPGIVVRRELQYALTDEAETRGMTRADLIRRIWEQRYRQKRFEHYMRAAEGR